VAGAGIAPQEAILAVGEFEAPAGVSADWAVPVSAAPGSKWMPVDRFSGWKI